MQKYVREEEQQPPLGKTEDESLQAVSRRILHKVFQHPQMRVFLVLVGFVISIAILVFIFQHPEILVLLLAGLVVVGRMERHTTVDLQWQQQRAEIKRLSSVEILEELRQLSPPEFEQVVEIMLQRLGYRQVKRTGGSGDLCVDIHAVSRRGEQIAIQCKRYAAGHKVGSEEMQTFIAMAYLEHKADWGLYVTTSSYTKTAQALGERHRIELVDGECLVELLRHVAPQL